MFQNWTVEFQGSETIAALAADEDVCNASTAALGGGRNGAVGGATEGMRFYFNDKQAADKNPSIVIVGAKLFDVRKEQKENNALKYVLTLSPQQGNGN
jgi:hypothetical protein